MNDKMPDKFTMQHIRDAIAQLKRRDKNDSEMQKQIEELGLTPREILLNKLEQINVDQIKEVFASNKVPKPWYLQVKINNRLYKFKIKD